MNIHKNIIDVIMSKTVNTIKVCYYPFYNKNNNGVIKLQNLSKTDIDKILVDINIEETFMGKYTEYGIRDTFVRISESFHKNNQSVTENNMPQNKTENKSEDKQKMFFRRENHILFLDDESGMFVLELYTICEEEEIPIIINYHHNIKCNVNVFIHNSSKLIQPLRLCFTSINENNASHQNNNNKSNGITYFNICRDITINKDDNFAVIDNQLQIFFTDVFSLKNEYNKNFTSNFISQITSQ